MSALETEAHAGTEFDARVDYLRQTTCEVARGLVGAHQAAMAMLVDSNWAQAQQYSGGAAAKLVIEALGV